MARLLEDMPDGDVAEVGVFNGGSAQVLYNSCLRQGRGLHLFDTFTGTPFYTEGLDRHKIDDEFAALRAEANIRHLLPLAKLYVGIYPETHPMDLPDLAFVHCDCDQYLSVKAVIDHMWPRLVSGGVMLFDDYPYLGGAKKAVEEIWQPTELRLCFSRYYAVKP
jgi:hypothetical protein